MAENGDYSEMHRTIEVSE